MECSHDLGSSRILVAGVFASVLVVGKHGLHSRCPWVCGFGTPRPGLVPQADGGPRAATTVRPWGPWQACPSGASVFQGQSMSRLVDHGSGLWQVLAWALALGFSQAAGCGVGASEPGSARWWPSGDAYVRMEYGPGSHHTGVPPLPTAQVAAARGQGLQGSCESFSLPFLHHSLNCISLKMAVSAH